MNIPNHVSTIIILKNWLTFETENGYSLFNLEKSWLEFFIVENKSPWIDEPNKSTWASQFSCQYFEPRLTKYQPKEKKYPRSGDLFGNELLGHKKGPGKCSAW